jgi:hypothetical protein
MVCEEKEKKERNTCNNFLDYLSSWDSKRPRQFRNGINENALNELIKRQELREIISQILIKFTTY